MKCKTGVVRIVSVWILLAVLTVGMPTNVFSEAQPLRFTILYTNDEHGALIAHSSTTDRDLTVMNPSIGGYARLATLVTQIRAQKAAQGEPTLLLSAGDFIGGTAFSWLNTQGYAPELSIKQMIGYDAITIGNHEYDYGTDVLTRVLQKAGYPQAHDITAILASNTVIPPSHPMYEEGLVLSHHMIELDHGLTIGLMGLIGKDAVSVASDYGEFAFEELAKAARRTAHLLSERGAHVIVAISHSGLDEEIELARDVPEIDVIVGGHCHTALTYAHMEGDTIIVQAGAHLAYLGNIELSYDPRTRKTTLVDAERKVLIPIDSSIQEDPKITERIAQYEQSLNDMISMMTEGAFSNINETIITSAFVLDHRPALAETAMGNFITDAMRIVTSQITGQRVDVAIQANGNIRGALTPGVMPYSKGMISFYDLILTTGLGYGTDGYAGYPVVSFWLTGQELVRALEVAALLCETMGNTYFLHFSGLRYEVNRRDAVLFTVPFVNVPLPSTRAVKDVRLYTEQGLQSDDDSDYVKIERDDQTLYHVVTDRYILEFLPLAGELLPALTIEPKDAQGRVIPQDRFDEFAVGGSHTQLKVWQTVVSYARQLSVMPASYEDPTRRIVAARTIPYVFWIVLTAGIVLAGLGFLFVRIVRRTKRKRRALKPPTR